MRFENFITLTASFVLFGSVSGDLCSKDQNDDYKYETDVAGEVCEEGYAARFCNETVFVCEPVCPAGCENGTCIAPGICDCAKGYELRSNAEKTECVPLTLNNDVRLTKAHTLTKRNAKASDDFSMCSCKCWKYDSEELCKELCESESDKCLEKKFSVCNESNSLVYKKNSTNLKYYCRDNAIAAEKAAEMARWFVPIGCIFIGIMLIAIVYLCVRIYQTRHETGAHDIPISLLMKF
ncbi:uncharacterized protein LOC120768107 [Bactrocera tryoni]|uniref:uncharacterized protein LOC120768107 n=1 Tax=Bactrocera tryoni TaxID=59916 RepID=UPI001A96749F|nr:uncharacterized protein LOC120768107 [Bactrocera tryoni]